MAASLITRDFVRFALLVLSAACTLAWPDMLGHASAMQGQARLVIEFTGTSSGLIYGMLLGGVLLAALSARLDCRAKALALVAGALGCVSTAAYALAPTGALVFVAAAGSGVASMLFYGAILVHLARACSFKEAACVSLCAFALKSALLPLVDLVPGAAGLVAICAIPLLAGFALALALHGCPEPPAVLADVPRASQDPKSRGAVVAIGVLSCVAYAMMRGASELAAWGSASPLAQLDVGTLLLVTAAYMLVSYATFAYAPHDILFKFALPLGCLVVCYLMLATGAAEAAGFTPELGAYVFGHFAELYGHMFWWLVGCAVIAYFGEPALRTGGLYIAVLSCACLLVSLVAIRPNAVWLLVAMYALLGGFILYTRRAREASQVRVMAAPASSAPLDQAVASLATRFELSQREREVLGLLAQGWSRERIGDRLGLAQGSVGTYCARLYKKMRVHGKQELLACVYEEVEAAASGEAR